MALTPITVQQAKDGLLSGSFWTGTTLTYSIPGVGADWTGGDLAYAPGSEPFKPSYSTVNATQGANFSAAMEVWDSLVGLSFDPIPDAQKGDIRIAFTDIEVEAPGAWAYAYLPPGGGGRLTGTFGDVWVDDNNKADNFTIGTFGFFGIMHEIGHSLGLKHTFEAPVITAPFDNSIYSVMSYTTSERRVSFTANASQSEFVYTATPMVADILAIQDLYGADTQTGLGITTYAITDADTDVRRTIYDAGGIDTIDLSALSRGSTLDLRPGAYSNLAEFTQAQQVEAAVAAFGEGNRNFYQNALSGTGIYTWTNNFAISFSTTIENAFGSRFADTIIGNDADNRFNAGLGADTLTGGGGVDSYRGTAAELAGDTITDIAAGETIVLTNPGANIVNAVRNGNVLTVTYTATGVQGQQTFTMNLTGATLAVAFADNTITYGGVAPPPPPPPATDDLFLGVPGANTFDGGAGNDTVSYVNATTTGVTVDLNLTTAQTVSAQQGADTLISIENLIGSGLADTLTGDGAANRLQGGAGNDILSGGAGNDTLEGGAGADTLNGGAGDDVLNGGAGSDTASYAGAAGAVTVSLATTVAQNTIGAGIDTLTAIENLVGSDGNDTLTGNDAANRIDGGAGADTINGGLGADRLTGGGGIDRYRGTAAELGGDTITDIASGETIVLTDPGATIVNAVRTGNVLTVTFTATATGAAQQTFTMTLTAATLAVAFAGNTITYGAPPPPPPPVDDLFLGVPGANTFDGGAGNDTVSYVNATTTGVSVDLSLTTAQTVSAQQGADTLISIENLIGSGLNDTLTGNAQNNRLEGAGGDDVLNGAAGDDSLIGGGGADTLDGGAGNDLLDGGDGIDTASYAAATGAVTVTLASTAAQNTGGAGTDTLRDVENLTGSAAGDTLTGNGLANRIVGGGGSDTLNGGLGADTLTGGADFDVFKGLAAELAGDTITDLVANERIVLDDAGAVVTSAVRNGTVLTVTYTATATGATPQTLTINLTGAALAFSVSGNTITAVPPPPPPPPPPADLTLNGTPGNDTLTGLGGNDTLNGFSGDDKLDGGAGNDVLNAGDGNDNLIGGAGNDALNGGNGWDTADYSTATAGVTVSLALQGQAQNTGGAGIDTLTGIDALIGSRFADTLTGDAYNNNFFAGAGNDSVSGGGGADNIDGQDGDDYLDGGAGWDVMWGGAGNDTYVVDDWKDVAFEGFGGGSTADSGGIDTVLVDGTNYKLGQFIENLTQRGTGNFEAYGNDIANRITGNSGNNWLVGNGGDDIIDGGAGNDRLEGSDGKDVVTGGAGRDTFVIKFMSDSKPGLTRDIITDFTRGQDVIDLGGIDASVFSAGDQGFRFIGTEAFTSRAGTLRTFVESGKTIVEGDVNGDRTADFQIELNGVLTLSSSDFIL